MLQRSGLKYLKFIYLSITFDFNIRIGHVVFNISLDIFANIHNGSHGKLNEYLECKM